jgi:hypothetical protein
MSDSDPRGYVIPCHRAAEGEPWFHLPGHEIDFTYRPEVPRGALTRQHYNHLARRMEYVEPAHGAEYAFAIGNLSGLPSRLLLESVVGPGDLAAALGWREPLAVESGDADQGKASPSAPAPSEPEIRTTLEALVAELCSSVLSPQEPTDDDESERVTPIKWDRLAPELATEVAGEPAPRVEAPPVLGVPEAPAPMAPIPVPLALVSPPPAPTSDPPLSPRRSRPVVAAACLAAGLFTTIYVISAKNTAPPAPAAAPPALASANTAPVATATSAQAVQEPPAAPASPAEPAPAEPRPADKPPIVHKSKTRAWTAPPPCRVLEGKPCF